jgi:hypothetical protein
MQTHVELPFCAAGICGRAQNAVSNRDNLLAKSRLADEVQTESI